MKSSLFTSYRRVALTTTAWIAICATAQVANADIPAFNANGSGASAHLVSDARAALQRGDLRLALIDLKNAVSAEPKNGLIRAQMGAVLLEYGDPVSAERELRQARSDGAPAQNVLPALFQAMLQRHEEQMLLDEFPDKNLAGASGADILRARALALQALDRGPEADAAMDKSLTFRRDPANLLTRARLAQQQGDLTLANRLADEAVQQSPDNPEVVLYKIGLQVNAGDNAHALVSINKLISRFPNNIAARFARVEIFLRLKIDSAAKADVDYVLSKTPNASLGIYYRALLEARKGDVKGAWRTVQVLPPEFTTSQPEVGVMVAGMAEGAGAGETGAALLSAMILKFPQDKAIRLRLAAMRLRENSPESALSVLQPVRGTNDPAVLDMLAQIYAKMQQYDNALDIYQTMEAHDIGGDTIKRDIALLQLQMGRRDQAIKSLMDNASKQPTDAAIVYPLVTALSQDRRYPEALAIVSKFGTDPKNKIQSLLLRAGIQTARHSVGDALAAYDQAIQIEPKNVPALYARATLLEGVQRYADASHDLHTVLTLDQKNISALLKLAEVEARQQQGQLAVVTLNQAIATAPGNPEPRVALIKYSLERQDGKGALAAANDFVRVQPNNADALGLKGQAQVMMGQKADAVSTFKKLVSVAPRNSSAYVLLANSLLNIGDRSGATNAVNQAVRLEPRSVLARGAQVDLQIIGGDNKSAVMSAQSLATQNPSPDADLLLASTFVRTKQSDQAISTLTQSLKVRPNNLVVAQLAQLLAASGNRKGASDVLEKWLAKNPNDIGVRNAYGMLLSQQNNDVKAASQYQLVLREDPTNVTALNNLGWIVQRDDPKRAVELLSQALQISPNSADVLDSLGWVKLEQRDGAGSLPLLTKAHGLRPDSGEIGYHLAVALYANDKHDDARNLLKNVLATSPQFQDRMAAAQALASWH